jgi:hypothetical protein
MHAAAGPDEQVAAELEGSAGRAKARGGLAAAAAFLQRATELTLDPEKRVERALAAASAQVQAGGFDGAQDLLSCAHDMFEEIGMEGFAGRANRELEATGETARKRTSTTKPQLLTAQESQIARMARDGHSNPEIGSRLFSAPAPWNTTCKKSSPSSTSNRANNSIEFCPTSFQGVPLNTTLNGDRLQTCSLEFGMRAACS